MTAIVSARRWGTFVVVTALLVACGDGGEGTTVGGDEAASESDVVARFDGGTVDFAEMDQLILSLPPDQRRVPGRDLLDWYEELARRQAFQKLMAREAERLRVAADPALVGSLEQTRRAIVAEMCSGERYKLQIEEPSEIELREEFEKRREELVRQESRLVYNLFVRRRDGMSAEEMRARLQALRDRAMGGEAFPNLAAEYSESETRHQQGLMGWMRRGDLVPDLEKVVFALEEGVPSQPLLTAEGGHLYFVQEAVDERQASYEEAREQIWRRMMEERRSFAMADWEDSLELPAGSFVPTPAQLRDLMREGDQDAAVLRIGDQEVPLRVFEAQLRQAREAQRSSGRRQRQSPMQVAYQVLRQLQRRELVYHHCTADGGVDEGEIEAAVQQWLDATLPAFTTQKLLHERLDAQDEKLKSFYEANPGRFATSPRWQIRRLTVPMAKQINELMERLEEARRLLDNGSLTIDDLAEEMSGTVEDLGWQTLDELGKQSPRIPRLVSPLRRGEHSPPVTLDSSAVLFEVTDRQEPEERSFDEVRPLVLNQYLGQHSDEVLEELTSEWLAEADFEILPGQLEALRRARVAEGPATTEGLVTEIKELLKELEEAEASATESEAQVQ